MATGKTTLMKLPTPEKPTTNTPVSSVEPTPPDANTGLAETLAMVESRLREMSVREKIELARRMSTELELHTDRFPRPPVLYGHLHGCADELEARSNDAQIGLGHWRMLASFEARQEALLDRALTQTAIYMQHTGCGGNAIVDPAGTEKRDAAEAIAAAPAQSPRQLTLQWALPKFHPVTVSNASATQRHTRGGARTDNSGGRTDL